MFLKDHDIELNSTNMLDVSRSDSQKSDSSQRPRVSFNRDVRIKKIGNSDAASIVEALAGDGEGHLVPTPVRRERIKASKRELALEADRVLKQADSVASLHSASPPRRQPRSKPDGGSLQRKTSFGGTDSKKWNSEGKLSSYNSLDRPKNRLGKREPPAWDDQREQQHLHQYRSSGDLSSTTVAAPKRRTTSSAGGGGRLTRSVSDAGDRHKPLANGGKDEKRSISLFGTIERIRTKMKKRPVVTTAEPAVAARPPPPPPPAPLRAKKQLSPIIESSPRDEYFKYSTGGPPFNYNGGGDDAALTPARPVRGNKVDRIVQQLQQQQQQQQQAAAAAAAAATAAAELARTPPDRRRHNGHRHHRHRDDRPSSPDFAHAHNGNEPFSYTASPTVVHLPADDTVTADLTATTTTTAAVDPPTPPQQYRSAAGMDDTWLSYDDLSHRRDALESRLQKRASSRPNLQSSGGTTRVSVQRASPDTYATVYKKNETLGGGDRYFERKIVTEHRFARRPPGLSSDGSGGGGSGIGGGDYGYDKPPPSRYGRPTVVSRNAVGVRNGSRVSDGYAAAEKPAKKRSRLDKFKMLFTGNKENKRPFSTSKVSNSDPESYTASLRKRYNVYTGGGSGSDDNKHGNYAQSGHRRMSSSPNKTSKTTGNNAWFKSLDRFGKKNNNKRSKTFTSGSENDDEIRVHRVNDRNNSKGTTRSYHSVGNLNSLDMDQSPRLIEKRHSLIDSSAGSTTEGDSSQKSHKSTVYLHATTVGEIPESRQLHQSVFGAKSRRAASREELSSLSRNGGDASTFGDSAHKRTLSRSVSVLAPWAPRRAEGRTVDYDERGRPPRAPAAGKKRAVKATKSDPEAAAATARKSIGGGRRPSGAGGCKSSGEESSLLDEVIIRTTSRTGELVKDDRSLSRQIGRSMSSVAANSRPSSSSYAPVRVRTKS